MEAYEEDPYLTEDEIEERNAKQEYLNQVNEDNYIEQLREEE